MVDQKSNLDNFFILDLRNDLKDFVRRKKKKLGHYLKAD